jgi:predicted membrane-bound dolichyl-phosphate-mannose-protein mannosyltransferase
MSALVADPVASSLSTVQVVSVLLGTFYPLAVALVTKKSTNPAVKAWLLAALSAASGFGFEFVNDGNFRWDQALLTSVVTFVTAVSTYYGLWKPTTVAAKVAAVGPHD